MASERVLADRYRLVRQLGAGGMGEVWEGRDETLGRAVAVKLISVLAGGGSQAGDLRSRFLREARITAGLQHPNIVTLHDLGEAEAADGTTPFLVMELLRGEGLDAVLRRGPVAPADAARWGAQLCDALGEAHARGVLHRDIKPANVHLAPSGAVKVLDFGIARAADPSATDERLTQTGFMVGTPQYMAPEHARGEPEPRSDLYAVGCVLFEMLTGRLPFQAPNAVAYLSAHLTQPPPAPGSLAPGLPAGWDALVLRLLHKDPAQRHASAAELATELRRLTTTAYTPTVTAPAVPVPAAPRPAARPEHLRTIPAGAPIVMVTFSPDGHRLLCVGQRWPVIVTDLTGREELRIEPPGRRTGWATATYTPDGQRLATTGADRTLRFWDLGTGRELRRVTERGYIGKPVFSPDGSVLATADLPGALRLRDPETGDVLSELAGLARKSEVSPFGPPAFSPDGTLLALPHQPNEVIVLRVAGATAEEALRIPVPRTTAVTGVAFSPDGTRLAAARARLTGRAGADVWNPHTGHQVLQVQQHRKGANRVAFSPRGDVFATAGRDDTARLWSVATGEELLKITHGKPVSCVAFSPDGSLLASAGHDRTVQLWRL